MGVQQGITVCFKIRRASGWFQDLASKLKAFKAVDSKFARPQVEDPYKPAVCPV
jgi:hypothetical protein